MNAQSPVEHQPRERLVPCQLCVDPRTKRPRRMTWAVDAICDQHAVHEDATPCTWPGCPEPRCRAYWLAYGDRVRADLADQSAWYATDDRTIQARD